MAFYYNNQYDSSLYNNLGNAIFTDLTLKGPIILYGQMGTNGQVLVSQGGNVPPRWTDAAAVDGLPVLGTAGQLLRVNAGATALEYFTFTDAGITTLNTLTATTQTFAVGTTGTDFAISSVTSAHTFNLPTASATNRGALSSADWTTFNSKLTLPALTAGSVLFSNGTTIAQDNANFFWDDTSNFLRVPTIIGGTSTTADLTLQTTSGIGATGADMHFLVGNNGATEALTVLNSGNVGIGTTGPGEKLVVNGNAAIADRLHVGGSTAFGAPIVMAVTGQTYLNGNVGIVTTTPSSKLDITTNSLGVTQTTTSGLALVNTTAAAAGAQQISPAVRWTGQGWKTDATAASQAVAFQAYVLPLQSTANPTGSLIFKSSINAGAYSALLALHTSNRLYFGDPASTTLAIGTNTDAPGGTGFIFRSSTTTQSGAAFSFLSGQGIRTPTSGATYNISSIEIFNPTSGTADYSNLYIAPTINQTGGANGITRGLYINPTLTAAADFRGLEVAGAYTATSGTHQSTYINGSFAAGAGSASYRLLSIAYTINNSGAQSGTATGIFLNATETALNSMGHNLMDLQVGGSSKFLVSNAGNITGAGSTLAMGTFGTISNLYVAAPTDLTTPAASGGAWVFRSNVGTASAGYSYGFRSTNGASSTTYTSGTGGYINFGAGSTPGFTPSGAGSGNYNNFNIVYSLNGTNGAQTGTATGMLLNATETTLNGMTHNLMDLQVGGVSQFKVGRTGTATALNGYITAAGTSYTITGRGYYTYSADGVATLYDSALTSFNRLQLGGTTSSFPSIKRNAAAINFRLADDSADADITAARVISTNIVRLKGYTVATLPAGTQGDCAFASDTLTPVYGEAAVGGGAVVSKVFYNGTTWIIG